MRTFTRVLTGLAAAAAVMTVACGADDPAVPDTAPASPDSAAPAASESFEVSGISASAYYAANCAACHGQQLEGIIGPPLTVVALTQADAVYVDAITNGIPGTAMVGWNLSAQDVDTLVAWLRAGAPD